MAAETARSLRELPKGDALATAQLAGIMAAKRTSELIPLCHPLPLSHVEVDARGRRGRRSRSSPSAETTAQTGVEMEALTAASVAALTVYDMAKAIDKEMTIADVAPRREDEGAGREGRGADRLGPRRRAATREDASGDAARGAAARRRLRGRAAGRPGRARRRSRRRSRELAGERAARAHDRRHRPRAARRHAGGDARRARARGARHRAGAARRLDREDAARPALARRRRRRSARRSSSTCPARPAAAATATRCSRPALAHALELLADDAHGHTSRRDRQSDAGAAARALRAARQDRAHGLRAAVRVRRRVSRGRRDAVGARPALDHARDGRRALARDGAQPADRRAASTRATRAPPAASSRAASSRVAQVVALLRSRRSRSSSSRSGSSTRSCAGSGRSRSSASSSTRTSSAFTWLCHLWLGAVDGLAPVGAWVAITGQAAVAGLDARRRRRALGRRLRPLLRALRRRRSTAREGLHSIVDALRRARRVRRRAALARWRPSRCLVAAGLGLPVGVLYWLGVAVVAALLAYEHSLVRPGDLRRLDAAFFTMNGVISVAFAVFVIVDARHRRDRSGRRAHGAPSMDPSRQLFGQCGGAHH